MRPVLLLGLLCALPVLAQEPPPPPIPDARSAALETTSRSPSVALPQLIGQPWSAQRVADEVGPPLAGEVLDGGGTLRYADSRNGATRVDLTIQRDTVYAVEIFYQGREEWLAEQREEMRDEGLAADARGFVSLVPFGRAYRVRVQASEGRVRLEHDAEGIRAGLAPPPVPPARPPSPIERPGPPPPADGPPSPPAETLEPEVFYVVEQRPELIGGLEGLQERVVYPLMAKQAGIEGKVLVQFIVDERGRVLEPAAVRCPDESLCAEAVRVVQDSAFEPGLQRGRPVKVRLTLPVDFKLR